MDTWERKPLYDEPNLTPNSGAVLAARSSIQNSGLTEMEAPPLVFQNPEPANKNPELSEKNVDPLKHSLVDWPADGRDLWNAELRGQRRSRRNSVLQTELEFARLAHCRRDLLR